MLEALRELLWWAVPVRDGCAMSERVICAHDTRIILGQRVATLWLIDEDGALSDLHLSLDERARLGMVGL